MSRKWIAGGSDALKCPVAKCGGRVSADIPPELQPAPEEDGEPLSDEPLTDEQRAIVHEVVGAYAERVGPRLNARYGGGRFRNDARVR